MDQGWGYEIGCLKVETSTLIILSFCAFFTASFLKGLTGLGFSTLCLGFLATFIDIRLAIPLVFLPSLSSNIFVMVDAGHFKDALKRFWILFLTALPGLLLGVWFLKNSTHDSPKAILGIVMCCYGLWGIKNRPFKLSSKAENRLKGPVGFISGMVNGATGSQIMPIMPYLLSLDMPRNLFIQTINLSFTINTLIMASCLGKLGLLSLPTIGISAAGIIPVAVGIFLGSELRKKISEERYRYIVFIFLILLGVNLLIRHA